MTDYFEVRVEGEMKNLKWIEIDFNKLGESTEDFKVCELITGVLMDFGKVSNDIFILNTVVVEGIPSQALIWTWPGERQGSYYIHYQESYYIIEDEK